MPHTSDVVQRNAEPTQIQIESSHAVLVHLLHQHARSFVLTTPQVAAILGKSEAGLRLAESRHRSKYGCDLLPVPLLQNAKGRAWSIDQIARWLARGDETKTTPLDGAEKPTTRRGRPRKTGGGFGELA
jgi:hypothetical protein